MILDAMPAGQPWLFGLLLWRTALRQAEGLNLEWRDLRFAGAQPSVTVRNGKGGKYRVVPAHPELVDAFRSVPHRGLTDKVFTGRRGMPLSARTAARWIGDGITSGAVAMRVSRRLPPEPAPRAQPPIVCATAAPDTGCSPASTSTRCPPGSATAAQRLR